MKCMAGAVFALSLGFGGGRESYAANIVPLKQGYYVQIDTPCSEASNSTLNLYIGTSFYATCQVSKIRKDGQSYLIWSSCSDREGEDENLARYLIISNTEFKVSYLSNGKDHLAPIEKHEASTVHFRYCPQSSLPEPWRSNDITALGATSYYYVTNTKPPDAYLALRSAPSSLMGQRVEEMPNGTLLQILEQRADGWWLVRNIKNGRQGWALSGNGTTQWIACCTSSGVIEAVDRSGFATGFKTPSNNIFCRSFSQSAEPSLRCDITDLSISPPRPPDCDLEWGDAFEVTVTDTVATAVCHGDTAYDDSLPVLRYGAVWNWNGVTCTSKTTGLVCLNPHGHGFRLSRLLQEVF